VSDGTATKLALSLGPWEILAIFGTIFLLFGAKKLPMLARGLGASIRNFKGELQAPPEEVEPRAELSEGTWQDTIEHDRS